MGNAILRLQIEGKAKIFKTKAKRKFAICTEFLKARWI